MEIPACWDLCARIQTTNLTIAFVSILKFKLSLITSVSEQAEIGSYTSNNGNDNKKPLVQPTMVTSEAVFDASMN